MFEQKVKILILGISNTMAQNAIDKCLNERMEIDIGDASIEDFQSYDAIIWHIDRLSELEVLTRMEPKPYVALCTELVEELYHKLEKRVDLFLCPPTSASILAAHIVSVYKIICDKKDLWMETNCLETMINNVPSLIWFKDVKGAHINVNDTFCHIVNRDKQDIIGRGHYYIWGLTKQQYEKGEFVCMETELEIMEKKKAAVFHEKVLTSSKSLRELHTYKAPIFNQQGDVVGTVGVAHDVTRVNKYHNRIMEMAKRDYLTGLLNRRFFYMQIRKLWNKGILNIIYCDLDDFKLINDTYGHSAGDKVLSAVGKNINYIFKEGVNARIGGDEFIIALIGEYSSEHIEEKIKALKNSLLNVSDSKGNFLKVFLSIGIAKGMYGECRLDDLLMNSDKNMYVAKRGKR